MDTQLAPLIDEHDVAQWLGLTAARVLRMAKRNEIPHVRTPFGEIRFRPQELTNWIAAAQKGASNAKPAMPTSPHTDAACLDNRVAIGAFRRASLASYLDTSESTIDRLDAAGLLPPAVKLNGIKLYTRESIDSWLSMGCPCREEFETTRKAGHS